MPIPKPKPGEKKEDFIPRCISTVSHEDPDRKHDQVVGMCFTSWRDHEHAQLGEADELDFVFTAGVHSLQAGPDGNHATFYLMNTAQNRNRWGVTQQALEHAIPTINRVALGCGKGHTITSHFGARMQVGEFFKGWMPDGYALGTAKVSDPVAWDNLRKGKWGPISVVISAFREVCSRCGQVLRGKESPWEHPCIKAGQAYIQVESFRFKRVDFIDVPAYPQAGLTELGGVAEPTIVAPLELVAGFYESQSIDGRGAGSPATRRRSEKKLTDLTIEQLQAKVTELEGSVATLTTDKTALETEKATLEAKVTSLENPEENPEIKSLNDKVAAMEAERHKEVLDACVEARFKASLATDKTAETEALKDFGDDMLKFMTLEASKVEEMRKAGEPSGPKSKYTDDGKTDLQAAIDNQREAFGFAPRQREAAE